ncbi:MAG TPA: SAM-dependent methyltransferase [Pseudonocardiaceae bacterium]
MRDWEQAWARALYGPGGFFARGERPAQHFRTAPLVGPELAEALLELLGRIDLALGRPDPVEFVDVGAGGGELAGTVAELAPPDLRRRLRVTAVEVHPPVGGDTPVHWRKDLPDHVTGLLVGHEWLDSVPCPVVQVRRGRVWRLAVAADGTERPGAPAGPDELAWLDRWWPLRHGEGLDEGARAEVGAPRDAAWANAVRRVRAGAALAVDYDHLLSERARGRFRTGTLAAYRAGRSVVPVPDGSCDLTAHVALDACAAAATSAAPGGTVLVRQRDALTALGLTGAAPPAGLAGTDPVGWLAATARAGRVAELCDPAGLGGFGWLLQVGVGVRVTDLLPGAVGESRGDGRAAESSPPTL